jgi:EF hand
MLLLLLTAVCVTAQAPKPAAAPSALAAPLRKFDTNRDGMLSADEQRLARQSHSRGGREAEPTARRWRDMLERSEKDFQRRRERDFDLNKDGKTDAREQEELRKVWRTVAQRYAAVRDEITAKYDRNDDGELNEQERNASRSESDRRRREEEDKSIAGWRKAAAPAVPEAAKN